MIHINTNRANDSKNYEEPKSENSSDLKNKIDTPSNGDLSGKKDSADNAESDIDVNDCLVTSTEDSDEVCDIDDTMIEIVINNSKSGWQWCATIQKFVEELNYKHAKIKLKKQYQLSKEHISMIKELFINNNTIVDVEVEFNDNLDLRDIAIALTWATGDRTIKAGSLVKARSNYDISSSEFSQIAGIFSSNSNYKLENILRDIYYNKILDTNDLMRYKIFDGIV